MMKPLPLLSILGRSFSVFSISIPCIKLDIIHCLPAGTYNRVEGKSTYRKQRSLTLRRFDVFVQLTNSEAHREMFTAPLEWR